MRCVKVCKVCITSSRHKTVSFTLKQGKHGWRLCVWIYCQTNLSHRTNLGRNILLSLSSTNAPPLQYGGKVGQYASTHGGRHRQNRPSDENRFCRCRLHLFSYWLSVGPHLSSLLFSLCTVTQFKSWLARWATKTSAHPALCFIPSFPLKLL